MKYSETNKPLQCIMSQSTCYNGTTTMDIKGVLWHSTGANNPWLMRYVQPDDNAPNRDELIKVIGTNKYGNDWNHSYKNAGLNCWIGKLYDGTVSTVQTLPWNFSPWGCGSGQNGSCNHGWIQFEICEDSLTDQNYFNEAYKEACEITAYLCKTFNIDPNGTVNMNGIEVPTILCHQDSHKLGFGSNHSDIYHWFPKFGYDMTRAREDVTKLLSENGGVPSDDAEPIPAPTAPTVTKFNVGDIVKIIGNTYYSGKVVPDWVKAKNWIVYSAPEGSDRIVVNESEDGKSAIMSPFKDTDLELITPTSKTPSTGLSEPSTAIPVSGTPSTGSAADEKTIWNYLMYRLGNEFGTAGVMGNLRAESSLRSDNLQNSYESKIGLDDKAYTAAVDDGTYTNFVNDHTGYGLAQWTYYTRKQAMLDYAKSKQKSIGDLATQLDFLYKELSERYQPLLGELMSATTVKDASNAFMLQFERPANQSVEAQEKRAAYGEEYYEKYSTPKSKNVVYTVKRGDTLYKIASMYGTTYKKLAEFNGIADPNIILIGQEILIPASTTPSARNGADKTEPVEKEAEDVTVAVDTDMDVRNIEVGDLVRIVGSTYYSGANIPTWVRNQNWFVYSAPDGSDRIVINESEDGRHSIMSPIRGCDLEIVKKH